MSGFVAVANLDDSPADASVLKKMAAFLTHRGPDGCHTRVIGNVGLAHTRLCTGDRRLDCPQPYAFDGRYSIVSDARIDGRDDLVAALERGSGRPIGKDTPDVELIVRAYAQWGEECVSKLIGDFAFALWDTKARRLFCARDHLGMKPLFVVAVGRTVAVSNSLECVRLHPRVSGALNDAAIADFLLFGENKDANTTTFRDIQRLPPAHWCAWSGDGVRTGRYWSLPIDDPIHFRRHGDYVDRFNELLRAAVTDRLRTGRVSVLMSGGVDSPALAATALAVQTGERRVAVDAVTSVYDHLIPDRERHYAGMIAGHLQIPIRYDVRDDEISIADWQSLAVATPEPVANPMAFAAGVRFLQTMARGVRVFLYGEGPDNALRYEWRPYLSWLARRGHLSALMRAVAADVVMHPRVPLWSSFRQSARPPSRTQWVPRFPEWLNHSFSSRARCAERWADDQRSAPALHALRPIGHASLDGVRWQSLFDDCDISGARGHAEFRHPFLDVRLLRYLLALPAMPWCRNKLIIRQAMAGVLPEAVLKRKKTPVVRSADMTRVIAGGLPRATRSPELLQYVDVERIPSTVSSEQEMRSALRPLGLGYWLQHSAVSGAGDSLYGIEEASVSR